MSRLGGHTIGHVVLKAFTYWHLQGGEEEAVLAVVEVGDMREAEVMSTMVATAGGLTVTGVFLTKRGASWEAMPKGTDLMQLEQAQGFDPSSKGERSRTKQPICC